RVGEDAQRHVGVAPDVTGLHRRLAGADDGMPTVPSQPYGDRGHLRTAVGVPGEEHRPMVGPDERTCPVEIHESILTSREVIGWETRGYPRSDRRGYPDRRSTQVYIR